MGTSELHPHFVIVYMCATTTHANFYLVMHSVLKNDSKKSILNLTPIKHHAQHLPRWHKEVNLQLHSHIHSLPWHHNNRLPFPLVFQSTCYLLHSFLASIMVWIGDANPILYGWQKKSCYINYGHTKGTPYKINFSHFLPRLRNQSVISEEINNSS
jgi:hypothetical protein